MKMMLVGVILLISGMSGYAQDQPDKLKADAENVVKIISGDRAKIQIYCEFGDLSDQIDQADREQDTKKAEELSHRVEELEGKLGPEFSALANKLKDMDPNSQDGHDIGSIFDKMDKLCEGLAQHIITRA
jgi:hypothetical protein